VLAVLAIACFPGLAQAEDNSGIQYETDVPTVPDNESSNIPSKNKSGGTNAPSESESEASKSDTPGGAVSGGNDDSGQGGGTPSGQSNQAGGDDGKKGQNGSQNSAGNIKAAESLPLTPAAESDDGGSSPLVPILIAVAVLAAISIGYFLYRQRKQGPDSPGSSVSSPKAG
jgi:cobalamin biosynthesis Mg chelatase CobN